tara:strand:- start:737 stop:1744 length:1008 start_codon:yes stop_codon:yes gene_type:complete
MRVGSLFTGVGGLDLGLEMAGHDVTWQVEYDEQCQSVLRRHWPNVKLHKDVCDAGKSILSPVDLICGGFPCQDLSVAGRREGLSGARSGLWWEFHRIISELNPRWVLIENVPGLLTSNGGEDMATLLHSLEELRYGWAFRICDSRYFVPQRRRRVFIVGYLGGQCPPEVFLESEGVSRNTAESRSTREGFASHTGSGSDESRREQVVARNTGFAKYEMEEEMKASSTLRAVHNESTDLVITHQDVSATLNASGSGTSRPGGQGAEPDFIISSPAPRRLTPRECERLQGFPDDWTQWSDTKKEIADGPRYRMMGNAVTVNVAKWLGEQLSVADKRS